MTTFHEVRCPNCNRLLCEVNGLGSLVRIKCPKCRALSQYPILRAEVVVVRVRPIVKPGAATVVGPQEKK